MVLTDDARWRLDALGYEYERTPKRRVDACDLCGATTFVVVAHRDRYGFPTGAAACLRCGLVFLDPVMTAEAYDDFYRSVYRPLVSAFHGRRIDADTVEAEQQGYSTALVALLEPFLAGGRGGRLLDVGGSTGVVAHALAQRFSLRATVLDPAPDEVARAASRGLATAVGTAESFSPGDDRFDVVLLCQTVDHLLEISASLAKLRRLIVDGGLLFVDIVDFRAAYLRAWSLEDAIKVDHPYSLTESTAEAYLARAGFRVLRKDYAADHLHVGYVCAPDEPAPETLPSTRGVEAMLGEMRLVSNAPRGA